MLGARRTLTPGQAKQLLANSPELLAELIADPEVVGLFVGALGALEQPAEKLEDGLGDVLGDPSSKKAEDELETP